MPAKDRRADRAARMAQRNLVEHGELIRNARIRLGLSQTAVATALGSSKSCISRIERGDPRTRHIDLWRALAVVGFTPTMRSYPMTDHLRDAGQIALLARLRGHVHAELGWAIEVPLPAPRDLRAWDALIRGPSFRIGVEAETRLRDAQATARNVALKLREGGADHVILLLAESRANSDALAAARAYLAPMLPLDTRRILTALRAGRDPGASGIVVL